MIRLGLNSIVTAVAIGTMTWHLAGHQPADLLAQELPSTPSPYAGQHSSVRGLTEAEIDDLRNGRGMGLARPAEINGYPGPRHTLDLADELALSDDQQRAIQSLFDQMKAEAIPLGDQLLGRYGELESVFRGGHITADDLGVQATQLGALEGQLRATHLKYHLLTRPLLTQEQAARYAQLRGYSTAPGPSQHPAGGHGGHGP